MDNHDTSSSMPWALARLRSCLVVAVALVVAAGCNQRTEPASNPAAGASAKASEAAGVPAKAADPSKPIDSSAEAPLHPVPPPIPHAKAKQPPPPSPKRSGKVQVIKTERYRVLVSDIELSAGESATATLEVRPAAAWAFNADYPVRVALSGMVVSTPPFAEFYSNKDTKKVFQITSGGMRLDIDFVGEAQGEDHVEATIRFGLCSQTTCQAVSQQLDWRVAVR